MRTEKPSVPLLDQLRDAICVRHYSLRAEQASVHWLKRFIHSHSERYPGERQDNARIPEVRACHSTRRTTHLHTVPHRT